MEVQKLISTTSASVVVVLNLYFPIMEFLLLLQCISDNSPQFSSAEIKKIAEAYGFHLIITSPYYPKANEQVECTLCTLCLENLLIA